MPSPQLLYLPLETLHFHVKIQLLNERSQGRREEGGQSETERPSQKPTPRSRHANLPMLRENVTAAM